jgi:hypothetical protein
MTLALPKSTAQLLTELTGDQRPKTALLLILRDAIAHRLERVEAGLRDYEAKDGMPFDEYKHLWETEDRPEHCSCEAETDYLKWEALVTRKKRIDKAARLLYS